MNTTIVDCCQVKLVLVEQNPAAYCLFLTMLIKL